MVIENIGSMHNEIILAVKNEIRATVGKWMELEVNMESEISQIQRDKYCMFSSLILNLCFYMCATLHLYNCVRERVEREGGPEGSNFKGEESITECM